MTNRIDVCLKERGISRRKLAERIGVAENTVMMYARGRVVPKIDIVLKMCEELGVDAGELFPAFAKPHDRVSDAELCSLLERSGFVQMLRDYAIQKEADGCVGCAYIGREAWKMPCMACRRNCKDYWRKEAE